MYLASRYVATARDDVEAASRDVVASSSSINFGALRTILSDLSLAMLSALPYELRFQLQLRYNKKEGEREKRKRKKKYKMSHASDTTRT